MFFINLFSWLSVCIFTFTALTSSENTNPAFHLITGQSVSMQTGDFNLQKEDLLIRGKEPISIKRFYSSCGRRDKEGGWNFLPGGKIELIKTTLIKKVLQKLNPTDKKYNHRTDYTLNLTLDNGSALSLEGVLHEDTNIVQFEGFNTPQMPSSAFLDELSAKNNYRNLKIEADLGYRTLTMYLPDGGTKFYQSNSKTFNNFDHKIFLLTSEEKPNGCKILYFWDDADRLSEIKTVSPSGKLTYAWAKFNYNGSGDSKHNFQITTSDGRLLQYNFTRIQRKSDQKESHYLTTVNSSFAPTEYYEYQSTHNKRGPSLESIRLPQGKILEAEYCTDEKSDNHNLVRFLKVPSASGMQTAYTFSYEIEKEQGQKKIFKTTQMDKEANLINCSFKRNGLPKTIEHLTRSNSNGFFNWKASLEKHSAQKFYFNEEGFLISKGLFNPEGNLVMLKHFTYDQRGNVIQESLYGDLTGEKELSLQVSARGIPLGDLSQVYSKYYRYSADEFNLRIEEKEESGLAFEYSYQPGSNLVTSKLTKDNTQIIERRFFEYNNENVLIKEIHDDGASQDQHDLAEVMFRKIKYITPSKQDSALNFPKIIEEKYLDLKTNQEKLLKKSLYTYSGQGLLVKEELFDASNAYRYALEYAYNDKQQLILKKDALGRSFNYAYDSNFNVKEAVEENVLKTFSYDQSNQLISENSLFDKTLKETTLFQYDYKNNLIETTDPQNHKTSYEYDAFSNCIKTTYPPVLNEHKILIKPTIEAEYDLLGNLTALTNGNNETTKTSYTIYKKPKKIEPPDGKLVKHSYYKDGRLKTSFLAHGTKELFFYDVLGNLTLKQRLSNKGIILNEEKWHYKGWLLLEHISQGGLKTLYSYDEAGRKIKEVQNDKKIIAYSYDLLGFEKSKKVYLNSNKALVEITKKDLAGRLVEERKENLSGTVFYKKNYSYDFLDNLQKISSYNQNGQTDDLFYYDAKKRLIKHSDPLGHIASFVYNDFYQTDDGRTFLQKTSYDPENNVTIETFDALSRLISLEKRDPLGNTISKIDYFYDTTGHKTMMEETVFVKEHPYSQKTTKQSFKNDQLLSITLAKDSSSEKTYQITYNKEGLRSSFKKPSGITLFYEYDENENLSSVRSSDETIYLTYQYDASGKLLEAEDRKQKLLLTRKYDAEGQLIEEATGNFKIQKQYDLLGRLTKLILPDNSSIDYVYNECSLKEVVRHNKTSKKTFRYKYSEFDLSLNPLETEIESITPVHHKIDSLNRTYFTSSRFFQQSIHQFSPAGQVLCLKTYAFPDIFYSYDPLFQLTNEEGLFTNLYRFDSSYALQQKNNQTFTTSPSSEMVSLFEYDQDGLPILAKKDAATYSYDALGRLAFFENSEMKIAYTYDPLGRRFSKKITPKANSTSRASINSNTLPKKEHYYFLNLDDLEIGTLNKKGEIKDLKILGQAAQKALESIIGLEIQGQTYAVLNDLRGNIAALLDLKSKQLEESYLYTAFGEKKIYSKRREELSRSSVQNPYGFQSKREEENGLIFFAKRYYDPKLARFLTPDPLGLPESSNPYAYAQNSPLNRIDRLGLFSETAHFQNNSLTHSAGKVAKGIVNAFTLPIKCTGIAVEFLGEHLVPIPIVQDLICIGGRFLQLNFSPFSAPSFQNSSVIKYGQFNPKADIVYVNGILNSSGDAGKAQRLIGDTVEKRGQTSLFYNPTKGLLGDLFECAALLFGFQTTSSKNLRSFLKDYLDDMDSDGHLMLMAHSGGALTARAALKGLSPKEKQMVEMRAFGPARTVSDKYAHSAVNYLSKRDLVGQLSWLTPSQASIKRLPARSSPPFLDHPFSAASYQAAARKEIDNFFE